MKNRKFISIIWGYHKQIFNFDKKQNYHMLPIEAMIEKGYDCEIFAIDAKVKIEDDPNFIYGTKVIYYRGFIDYLFFLLKNKNEIIYSNSLTIKTLMVGLIGKNTFFYSHSYPLGDNFFKKKIIIFFLKFFKKVRINNSDEYYLIEKIKNGLGYILPLSISNDFLSYNNLHNRINGTWIGNITNIKNPIFLIEAAQILKQKKIDFSINVIGEDRLDFKGKNFKELVISNKLEKYINIIGVLNEKEIKKILSKSLIYINTSISEGQCLAVYEGALSGNFLCLQNIIAFPSVFGENAFYHKTPEELVDNIIYILNNKSKLNKLIINNQKMILDKYDYEYIKNQLKKLFK